MMPSTDFISDPKILFDNVSGHWFASILDVTNGSVYVAASLNGSPFGGFYVYILPPLVAGAFPDRPILGVSKNLVAIGANEYTSVFVGGVVWAVNKSAMILGHLAYFSSFGPHLGWFSIHPVHSISATTKEYLVMTSGSPHLKVWNLTGTPSASTHATLGGVTNLSILAYSTPPPAPQKGTTGKVDTGDTRILDAVWRSNVLWLTFTTGCTPSGDVATRSCIRLTELSTLTKPSVTSDFNFAKKKTYLFYGALGLDGSLNLGVVYGLSNSSLYPILAATGHLAANASGVLLAPVYLVRGTSYFNASWACTGVVCRWGDYYGVGADPTSPNFWVAGEYCEPSTYWSTWISSIKL
ncbi:MAG: hypothetical protein ACHQ0I_04485 [Candidatus Lutacidiplasmatales archaeon]